ncbi:MAG: hypothetical protein ABJG78_08530 [Cyclobacteriaceae bacterium]
MKTLLLTILIAFSSFFGSHPQQKFKRYGIKSGIIEYELSGAQSGKETVYFDDWGYREAKYTEAEFSFSGFTQKNNSITIMEGKMIYSIDLSTNTGTKVENTMFDGLEDEDLEKMGEKMMKEMGGEKTGTEEVMNKECDVWEIKHMGSKTWVWKSIPLKTEVNMGMQMNIVATSITEGDVPAEKFEIPEGITFQDAGNLDDIMKKLKEGG